MISRRHALSLLAMSAASITTRAEVTTRKLGIALVGLGTYSREQLGPSLKETESCYLAGIVTGSPEKVPVWQEEYGLKDSACYSYETFDEIANNDQIDIIYIVLPDGMHCEWVIKAAKLGKHVICEKPMAKSLEECEEMIAVCKENKVTLQIGYRMYYDPYHLRLMASGAKTELGQLKNFDGALSYYVKDIDPNHWGVSEKLSVFGSLGNMGVYPVQGAFYCLQDKPISVSAEEINTRPDLFKEVPEGYKWELRYADGKVAKGRTGLDRTSDFLKVVSEKGSYELDPCFAYRGLKGSYNGKKLNFPKINQQAQQMDWMAKAILQEKPIITPGEMGARDVQVLEAVAKAAKTKNDVEIEDLAFPALPKELGS